MDRRRARRGPAADVRVHRLGRQQRRRPVPRRAPRCCSRSRACSAAGSRRGARRRSAPCWGSASWSRPRSSSSRPRSGSRCSCAPGDGAASAARPCARWRPCGAAAALPLLAYGVLGATVWNRPVVDRVGGGVSRARPGGAAVAADRAAQLPVAALPPAVPELHGPDRRRAALHVVVQGPGRALRLAGLRPARRGLSGGGGRVRDRGRAGGRRALAAAAPRCAPAPARRSCTLLFAAGLALAIAVAGYRSLLDSGGVASFEQARYLLPLLGLYALFPALAVRAGGPRWAGPIAIVLVTGVLGHSLLAQIVTLSRYYT